MVLPAHDLRRHVAGRAAGFLGVVGAPNPGDAEVGQPQVALGVED